MTELEMQVGVAREDLCRYLAACYYEPEPAFEEEGMFGSMAAAAQLLDVALVPHVQRLRQAFKETKMDELLIDYTRLFLGPTSIPAKPYGSVWLEEETLMGESTMAVLELYREADFEMDDEFKELPDHIAVELEFLYLLLFRENEARGNKDDAKCVAAIDLQRRFLTQHLAAWVGKFAAAVKREAEYGFYRELADLTEKFVVQQLSRIR